MIDQIFEYENGYILKIEKVTQSIIVKPSPDVKYKINNEYLKVLIDLIIMKLTSKQIEESKKNREISNDIKFLVKILLNMEDEDISQKAVKVVDGYYFENSKGDKAIISDLCEVLLGDKNIDFDNLLSEFKNGKRTNLSEIKSGSNTDNKVEMFTNYAGMNSLEIKKWLMKRLKC